MKLQTTLSMLIPLISFLSYCGLLALSLKSPRSRVANTFIGYLSVMLIWSLGSFMMRTGISPGPLAWNRFMLIGMAAMPFVFYHFSREILGVSTKSFLLFAGYAFYVLLLIANVLGFIVQDAYLVSGEFRYSLGGLAASFAAIATFYILVSAVLLTREGFKNPASFWSNRLLYPSIGSMLILITSLLNLVPLVGKYPIDIAGNTINAFLLTYSIYHYRLLNITITIRKGVVYFILTVMLTSSYLFLTFFLEKILSLDWGTSTAFTFAILMAALISLIFDPTKEALKVWVDKIFFGEQYDYRKTLKDFSHLMTSILDLNRLTQSTLELVTQALQIRSGAILLTDEENNFYVHASLNICEESVKGIRVDRTNPVVHWLSRHDEPILSWNEIETEPDFHGLWEREKEDLLDLKAQMLVGIKIQGELTGIFLLSGKITEDPFTDDDHSLLVTLANEAAIAFNNALIYNEVKSQAIRDELTNLYNYRFFHEFMDKEIARGERSDKGFSLVFLDLDLFKAYNDIFGHLEGDQALAKVADAILKSVRASDVAARQGGDEFAVVLPGTDVAQALEAAKRIKEKIKQAFPGSEVSSEMLTVSIGLAHYPLHATDKNDLLSAADNALYLAKRLGRNQIAVANNLEDKAERTEIAATQEQTVEAEKFFFKKQAEEAYLSTIYTLAAAINARDNYTYHHSEMVTFYAVQMAEAIGMSEEQKKRIRHAAMLHDIGKIGIPEYILNKPGTLSRQEKEVIKRHVNIADAIVNQTPYLRGIAPVILHHHEAFDGSGYPHGLAKEKIPYEARILSIADAFHAMTSDRPYRKAMPVEEALNQLLSLGGTQFDPDLIPTFIRMIKKQFLIPKR